MTDLITDIQSLIVKPDVERLYKVHDRKELVYIEDGFINIDETRLDLFDYGKKELLPYEPDLTDVRDFLEAKIIHWDIETTGGIIQGSQEIDYVNHQIALIGIMNERGEYRIYDALEDETFAILMFFEVLKNKLPDILNIYNGFFFDIRFIIGRCNILGIKHPFWKPIDEDGYFVKKRRSVVQMNNRVVEYEVAYLNIEKPDGSRHHCAIIDSFHEVLAWDFVKRKLTGYRLKDAPYQMGLVDEEIIDLEYPEMLECYDNWEDWGREKMTKYLISDLKLTKALGDFLLPAIWYQQMLLDWKLQSLASSGNGSKWNYIVKNFYESLGYQHPESSQKLRYKGAYTLAIAGLFGSDEEEVCKVDVESLYPGTMDLYQICSDKDPLMFALSVLKYLKDNRIALKRIADEDPQADQKQGVMKVLINSAYGQLAAMGIEYNDYIAAAFVTAYARGIFRVMLRRAREFGATLLTCDTDGICVLVKKGQSEAFKDYVQKGLPGQDTNKPIKIELEWVAKKLFIPSTDRANLDMTLLGEDDNDGYLRPGLKKNYIIVFKEKKKISKKTGEEIITIKENSVKANGLYRKRNRYKLEKECHPTLVELIATKGVLAARKWYRETRLQLVNQTYPLEKLSVTRKISAKEVNIIKQGVGISGEVVTIWKSHDIQVLSPKTGKPLKSKAIKGWTNKGEKELIDWQHYIEKFDAMFYEVIQYC